MSRGDHCSRCVQSELTRISGRSTAKRKLGFAFVALLGTLVVGCGGEPRLVPPNDQSGSPTIEKSAVPGATPRGNVAFSVGPIIWTAAIDETTNAPIEPVSSYVSTTPRIIAAVPVQSLPAGAQIEASWEYNDTSLDAFTTQLSQAEMIDRTWIAFHIERDPAVPWPVGTYQVSVAVNGTTMQVASVEVIG